MTAPAIRVGPLPHPEPAADTPADHHHIAAILRAARGAWHLLPDAHLTDLTVINFGQHPAYRPVGHYQATVRSGAIHAAYLPAPVGVRQDVP